MNSNNNAASNRVDILTNFLDIILILATMSIIPVRIIVYAPRGMKEVSIPV
jgi:hypothetical protein